MKKDYGSVRKEAARKEFELARALRSNAHTRSRKKPASVPNKLSRISIFSPKNRDLCLTNKERIYPIDKHSVLRIIGRELGSKHRDLLYAFFCLKPEMFTELGQTYCLTKTTWRELLTLMKVSFHKNNIRSMLDICTDFQNVVIQVFNGSNTDDIQEKLAKGLVPSGGFSENIISSIKWDDASLDSKVTIRYGAWVQEMFYKKKLVSLNVHVQFQLKSGYAKSFWPFIDSQPKYTYIKEDLLAQLVNVDLYNDKIKEDGSTIKKHVVVSSFRRECRKAFDDMVQSGGLKSWSIDKMTMKGEKSRIYHYEHFLPNSLDIARQTLAASLELNKKYSAQRLY